MRVWVPLDAAARALGADAVAEALGREFTVTRNGTRGMIWLEPLVEVERDGVRHGYGPVAPRTRPRSPRRSAPAASIRWRWGRSRNCPG